MGGPTAPLQLHLRGQSAGDLRRAKRDAKDDVKVPARFQPVPFEQWRSPRGGRHIVDLAMASVRIAGFIHAGLTVSSVIPEPLSVIVMADAGKSSKLSPRPRTLTLTLTLRRYPR
jgi:hypothetical protein